MIFEITIMGILKHPNQIYHTDKFKARKLLICLLLLFHAGTSSQAWLFGYSYQSLVVTVSWRNGSSGLAICIMLCCSRNGSSGSAICAFTVQSVKDRFADRVYKYRETLTSVYSPLPAEKIPADSSPGKVSGCLSTS